MNVVFDLGGVVLSWSPTDIIASVFDTTTDRELVLEQVFGHPDWVELDRGTLDVADAVEGAAVRTGLKESQLRAMFEAVPRFLIPIPDSVMLVEAVRDSGSLVFALSNLHRSSLSHIDATYSVFELFAGRVISCEVGACKPEAEIYSLLLEREGLDPLETVFIDDVQANLDVLPV
ncbi:MAG TPA: hypothetical protein DCP20_02095 [Coriobacteriia bacterium]|nr:hypothetical protein [Coriobacteriia bacterium]